MKYLRSTLLFVLVNASIVCAQPALLSDIQRLPAPDTVFATSAVHLQYIDGRLALLMFDQGIRISDDSGRTWIESNFQAGEDSEIVLGKDGAYYLFYTSAYRLDKSKFLRSTDRGVTWDTLGGIWLCRHGIAVEDDILFSTLYGNSRYNTTTNTIEWLADSPVPYIWCSDERGIVYGADDGLYYSIDRAHTWFALRDSASLGRVEYMQYLDQVLILKTWRGIFLYNIAAGTLKQLTTEYRRGKLAVNEANGEISIVGTRIYTLDETTGLLDSIVVTTRFGEEFVSDALPTEDGGWLIATFSGYFYRTNGEGTEFEELSRPFYALESREVQNGWTSLIDLGDSFGWLYKNTCYITQNDGSIWKQHYDIPFQRKPYIHTGGGACVYVDYDSNSVFLQKYDVSTGVSIKLTSIPEGYLLASGRMADGEFALWQSRIGGTDSFNKFLVWSEASSTFTTYSLDCDVLYEVGSKQDQGVFVSAGYGTGELKLLRYLYSEQRWEDISPDVGFKQFYITKAGLLFALCYKAIYISSDNGSTWIENTPDDFKHVLYADMNETSAGDLVFVTQNIFYFYSLSHHSWVSWSAHFDNGIISDIMVNEKDELYFLCESGIYKYLNSFTTGSQYVVAPASFSLSQSYPNPVHASGTVTIPYELPLGGDAVLTVYDIHGRVVERREVSGAAPGTHSTTVTLSGHPAGVYMYTLSSGGVVESRKMVITH